MTKSKTIVLSAALIGAGALAGCNKTYYSVTNLDTGNVFYTKKVKELKSGSISFIDRRNGNEVRISNAEIEEIEKQEYRKALNDSDIERTDH